MEVNIPGEIRQKIISEFESPNMPVRTEVEMMGRDEINHLGRVAYQGDLSERRESSESFTAPISEGTFDLQREDPELNEPTINHLFPVWKCLVNNMNYDSLLRFKAYAVSETVVKSMEL